jgi:hypothetical protein
MGSPALPSIPTGAEDDSDRLKRYVRASRHSTIECSIYFQLRENFVHVRARPRMAESLIVLMHMRDEKRGGVI